ncbi:zinc finger BED domain-containing protein 5-like [Leptinotarsa decemlineata]|uniref:zinc finger BED domain-containing protein 5-like n=1 Tax=Leptinotarsa decemlineata TaxID=7539 RepID=UPI003D30C114
MKPSLLKRHQTSKHPDLVDKPIEFFQRKSELSNRENRCMAKFVNTDKKLVKASYLASYRIAKKGKPHTIGETLLLPVAKDMVEAVLGEKAANEIEKIPLSNDTVKRRIVEMSSSIEEQLLLQLRECNYFALQVDESTDIKNMAQLLVFIRFDYQSEVKEEFLFCKPLESNTKAEDIFNVINEYIMKAGISWFKCVGLCTDGAKAMSGHLSGLGARIKKVAPECQSTHCVIHREALASKGMPANLKSVLTDSVKVINFIKARALNSRFFSLMCEDMAAKYQTLLLHTVVRWLSRGKILTRLFELRSEVFRFLSEQNHDMKHLFNDEEWLSRLAYLADIFDRLNILNMGLQGPSTTVFTTNDKISSFKKKLVLFRSQAQDKDFSAFPILAEFLEENDISLKPEVTDDITSHMEALQTSFD